MIRCLLGVCLCAVALVGCYSANIGALRTRAAFDLECPSEQLRLTQLHQGTQGSGDVYGVEGCGKRNTYVSQSYKGLWLLDNGSPKETSKP